MNMAVGAVSSSGSGTKLVVGIDGSPGALHGAAWAVETAAPDHLPVLLVHALAPQPDTPSPPHSAEFASQHRLEAHARLSEAAEVARETIRSLTTRPGATELRTEVRIGDAYTVLREAAADARILVLGSKPPTLVDASTVTTAALIAHCRCPVVVVKSRPFAGGPVVVAVRSAEESDAVEFAFHQATLQGGRLLAVHCDKPGHDAPLTPDVLATWLESASRRHPRVVVEPVITCSDAADTLIDLATTSDLLVLGSGTRRPPRGMLGRTGAQVLLRAPCTTAFVGPPHT